MSSCSFDGFKRSLEATLGTEGSHVFVATLMEWWDTINSFHIPWEEMTITPYDYAILTGLPFTNKVVAVDDSMRPFIATVRELVKPFIATVRELVEPVYYELGRSENVHMLTLA